jgi:putative OPT family oligopeptide transporter
MRELSPLAIVLGIVIGIVLGAANAFVGLQVGMTVSASIPAAVISMGIMRGLLKRGTLLENNMVQTMASPAEALAAGLIFTVPALFLMGAKPDYWELVIWGAIGGLMGVFFMVPLRRSLIIKEKDILVYPEGVACAEVLEAGQRGGIGAKTVFWGLGVGAFFEIFRYIGAFAQSAVVPIQKLRTAFTLDASPALLGVGYIIGPRVAGYMLGGAVLGWFLIIPAIAYFGQDAGQIIAPAETLIRDMSPGDIWDKYLRFIGAGAVILGGVVSLIKSIPTICSSFWEGFKGLFGRGGRKIRTDRDIPMPLLVLGIIGLWALMWYVPQVNISRAGAVAVLVFGFFFVTVSSRLVGIVGSSSNPVSGMTIATLLGVSLIFTYFLKDTSRQAQLSAITVGALVCIALCKAGDISQDLKTGYLVKATPWKQQVGQIIAVLTSILALAGVILLLHEAYGFERTDENPNGLLAPQANIMKVLVEGVMGGQLPWVLVIMGMAAAAVVELLGLPALPFAVGLYLPLELSTPIMVGGLIRWVVGKIRRQKAGEMSGPGMLGASGLVAGAGLMGVLAAAVTYGIGQFKGNPQFTDPITGSTGSVTTTHLVPWLMGRGTLPMKYNLPDMWWDMLPFAPFIILAIWLVVIALRKHDGGWDGGAAVAVPPGSVGPGQEPIGFGEPPESAYHKPVYTVPPVVPPPAKPGPSSYEPRESGESSLAPLEPESIPLADEGAERDEPIDEPEQKRDAFGFGVTGEESGADSGSGADTDTGTDWPPTEAKPAAEEEIKWEDDEGDGGEDEDDETKGPRVDPWPPRSPYQG